MRNALIVGGANGIGLSIATVLAERQDVGRIYIVDKSPVATERQQEKFMCYQFDLTCDDYGLLDQFKDIDTLMITAGFGKLALFSEVSEEHIVRSFNVNTVAAIRVIKHFYDKLLGL